MVKPPHGSQPPRGSKPTYDDPPDEATVVMPGAPATGRPPTPRPPAALDSARALPDVPPATPSDRVLLPDRPERERESPPTPAKMPGWVTFYVVVALALALVGGCVLFVESRIVGHF